MKNKPGTGIRIISGKFKGRRLPVPVIDGLRPTSNRTKETLFNWLMQDIRDAQVLDLFAGTGSLGFECLSRHAAHCTMVELERRAFTQLEINRRILQITDEHLTLIKDDALAALPRLSGRNFDVIFLDPPFGHNLLPNVLSLIAEHQLLRTNGFIYIEHEAELESLRVPNTMQVIKQMRTRNTKAMVLQSS